MGPKPLAGTQERKGNHRLRDPPWGVRDSGPTLDNPALGSDNRKTSPLAGLKPSGAYKRAVRNWASALEEHTDLLAPSQSVEATH